MPWIAIIVALALQGASVDPGLSRARDAQDRNTLQALSARAAAAAEKQLDSALAQHSAAMAYSYLAEVAIETGDKGLAREAAETGIKFAERGAAADPRSSEMHRLLGTLCGQVIPASVLAGLKYGRCAMDEISKAVQLDPNSALNYVSRGVGNYYLPAAFGGGVELAIQDFRKAIELDPKSAEAFLWMGIAQRKANQNSEARRSLEKAISLNPSRSWAKQQLEKIPKP